MRIHFSPRRAALCMSLKIKDILQSDCLLATPLRIVVGIEMDFLCAVIVRSDALPIDLSA
jgi:hypothetical protein